jgi:hypothetical protein
MELQLPQELVSDPHELVGGWSVDDFRLFADAPGFVVRFIAFALERHDRRAFRR